jgi:CDP-diglyceride synthetase
MTTATAVVSETAGRSAASTTDKAKKKSLWSDVPRRLATICIGVPMVWKFLERPVTAYIFFFGAHGLSAWEYSLLEPTTITTTDGVNQKQPPLQLSKRKRFLFCAASLALAAIPDSSASLFSFLASLTAGIFALANLHHWMVGLLVVTIPFRAWCNLASSSDSSSFASTIAVLLTVWNTDTGALIAGRLLGRRGRAAADTKRGDVGSNNSMPSWIRRISPAKTMEGFLGGILGGTATAVWMILPLLNRFSIDTSPGFRKLWGLDDGYYCNDGDGDDGSPALCGGSGSITNRIILGLSLSVLAILGDLVESSIKRRSQSKDSGSVLPGHGGILDRFDSSLLAVLFYRVALEQATALVSDTNDIHTNRASIQQENLEL